MRRRPYAVLAFLLSVLVVAGPVAAHDFTGSEEKKTRNGTVYTNNVKCAGGSKANAQGVRVYHQQSSSTPTSGGIGICNDGSGAVGSRVIQGRAVAQGSTSGGSVYADGDKNNPNAQSQGWARVDGKFGPSAPKVRCGDAKGRKDATHSTSADTQSDCG